MPNLKSNSVKKASIRTFEIWNEVDYLTYSLFFYLSMALKIIYVIIEGGQSY